MTSKPFTAARSGTSGRHRRRPRPLGLLGLLVLLAGAPAAAHLPPQQAPPPPGVLPIQMLSNRADLISDGNALLEIQLEAGTDPALVTVEVDGRDVTASFAVRPNGRFEGLVSGLVIGDNVLRARVGEELGGRITITNHPRSGPVFAGPQVQPWICATAENGLGEPQDSASCQVPTQTHFEYKSATTGEFLPYDPDNPPTDVAMTTTDAGVTVPYIVRLERGVMDRGIYAVAVLYQPGEAWAPWAPQTGWNGKVLWLFGDGLGTSHVQNAPPDVREDLALSRGYLVAGSGLDLADGNANDVVSSEVLMMLGEHIFENYGEIRYTIGRGCGGGAALQLLSASAYPRLLNGLILECGVPDFWTTFTEDLDCGLLVRHQTQTAPALWPLPTQRAASAGHASILNCTAMAERAAIAFDPSAGEGCGGNDWAYHPESNPAGARCTPQDAQQAVFGARPVDGFAPRAFDNVGVQYALSAVQSGAILPEQFVDLNEGIGCFDIDGAWQPERCAADALALQHAYASGRVAGGPELARLPILELRNSLATGVHYPGRSLILRARLDRDLGYHDHHVIWGFPGGTETPDDVFAEALMTIDDWLAVIEGDITAATLEEKVLLARPASAVDSCFPDLMNRSEDATLCGALVSYTARGPRAVAGAPATADVLKCNLRPFDPGDFSASPVPFTAAQLARLEALFADGVCDFSVNGVWQGPQGEPPQSFADGAGGTPLGLAPGSQALEVDPTPPVSLGQLVGNGGGLSVGLLILLLGGGRQRLVQALVGTARRRPAPAASISSRP